MKSKLTRFVEKFLVGEDDQCWEWQAGLNTDGYGLFRVDSARTISAHIFSWLYFRGEIPVGLCVLHTCDNRKCVNPNHLWLGTRDQNNKDRMRKGRHYYFNGDKSPNSKFSNEQADYIRNLYATGEYTYKQIASIYSVDLSTIHLIVRGKHYAKKG